MYLDPRCYGRSRKGRKSTVRNKLAYCQLLLESLVPIRVKKGFEPQVQVYLDLIYTRDDSQTAAATHRTFKKRGHV